MYAIVDPNIGAYVSGFHWTGEPDFSLNEKKAITFDTDTEARECARSNAIHGVVIVKI